MQNAEREIEKLSPQKMQALQTLKFELDSGRRSGEENGWLSPEEVAAYLRERYHG